MVKVVLGLCGSGKSHLVEQLSRLGFEPFDEGVVPGLPKYEPFLQAVKAGKDCVVVDIAYCYEAGRAALKHALEALNSDHDLHWLCFENDLATANANCAKDQARARDVQGNHDLNARLSAGYEYPASNFDLFKIHAL